MKKVAVPLLLLLAAVPLLADHAPEWLLAKRSTVPRVLGMSVDGTTLRDVIRRLGKPSSRTTDPKFPSEAEYTFRSGELTIKVTTMFPPASNSPATENVTSFEISGTAPNERKLTEHGLRLGDGLQTLVQTYGWRYLTHWRRTKGMESAAITILFQDESELTAWFDDDGRIVRVFVRGSVE
jgi:hypothetical protein